MKLFLSLTLFTLVVLPPSEADSNYGKREPLRVYFNANDNDSERLQKLLQQTHNGVPEHDITITDPFIIPSLDKYFDSHGLLYENRNVNVTGVKDQKVLEFRMDPSTRTIVLRTLADLTIDGVITGIFTKLSKSMAGRYWAQGKVLSTATCSYELMVDYNGVERIAIGPEVFACEVVNAPNVQLNTQLEQVLCADSDASRLHLDATRRNDLRNKNFCTIVEEVYKTVLQNIRVAAEVLPASVLFKNLR